MQFSKVVERFILAISGRSDQHWTCGHQENWGLGARQAGKPSTSMTHSGPVVKCASAHFDPGKTPAALLAAEPLLPVRPNIFGELIGDSMHTLRVTIPLQELQSMPERS
jgi:hypothetical protein